MFTLVRASLTAAGMSVGLVIGGCSSPADDEILAMDPTDEGSASIQG